MNSFSLDPEWLWLRITKTNTNGYRYFSFLSVSRSIQKTETFSVSVPCYLSTKILQGLACKPCHAKHSQRFSLQLVLAKTSWQKRFFSLMKVSTLHVTYARTAFLTVSGEAAKLKELWKTLEFCAFFFSGLVTRKDRHLSWEFSKRFLPCSRLELECSQESFNRKFYLELCSILILKHFLRFSFIPNWWKFSRIHSQIFELKF